MSDPVPVSLQEQPTPRVSKPRQRGRDEVIVWLEGRVPDELLFRLVVKFGSLRHER